MNEVQPIRDKRKIASVRKYLHGRNRLLFSLGINFGLRISDLLSIKVDMLLNKNGSIKPYFDIVEEKTDKARRITLSPNAKKEIKEANLEYSEGYLFPSRKGSKAIGRVQAYRILNEAAAKAGLEEIGTHSLRKTFGYHAYKAGTPIEVLQSVFRHSSPHVTLAYIGIQADTIAKVYTVQVNL
jgi:integrase